MPPGPTSPPPGQRWRTRASFHSQANPSGGRGSLPRFGHRTAGGSHHRHLGAVVEGQAVALRLGLGDADDLAAAEGEEALVAGGAVLLLERQPDPTLRAA